MLGVTLAWGDGEYPFRLGIAQFRELQEKVNKWRVAIGSKPIGPREFAESLHDGNAWPDEVAEVLRLGLIGGGMKPVDTLILIKRYGPEGRPLLESSHTAYLVVLDGLAGVPDDPVGKKQESATAAQTIQSDSAKYTEPEPPLASAQDKSMNSPSGNSPPVLTDTTEPTAEMTSPSRQPGLSSTP